MALKVSGLRAFLTVAEAGNIKDAAEKLFRTSSAVSMTLTELERDIGGALFEKDRKSRLTPLGEYVREVATVMLRDHDHALELIRNHAQGRSGRLRLATVPSVASRLLAPVLRKFAADYADVRVELIDTDSFSVLERVRDGEADLGICGTPPAKEPLSFEPWFADSFRLVCLADDPLTGLSRAIRFADITGREVIINESSSIIHHPDYARHAAGSRYLIRNMTSLLAMVQAGTGITILPALACATLPGNLTSLNFEEGALKRVVGLSTRLNVLPNPVCQIFLTLLRSESRSLLNAAGLTGTDLLLREV